MKFRWSIIAMLVGIWSFAGPSFQATAQDKDITIDGQVKIGVHKFKLDTKNLYELEVAGKGFSPMVNFFGVGFLSNRADFIKERNTFRAVFMPPKSDEFSLVISPSVGFGDAPMGLLDYKVTLKAMKLDEKALISKADKLTAEDPKYATGFGKKTAFKGYTLKMNKGQTYVIDMVAAKRMDNKLDPYLYLENPAKMLVAQDDDGGGFPNARIVYTPMADGEFRIIASGLSDRSDVGDYMLTVRTVTK